MFKTLLRNETILIFILYSISSIISGLLGLKYAFFKIILIAIIFIGISFKNKAKGKITKN